MYMGPRMVREYLMVKANAEFCTTNINKAPYFSDWGVQHASIDFFSSELPMENVRTLLVTNGMVSSSSEISVSRESKQLSSPLELRRSGVILFLALMLMAFSL